MVFLDDVVLVVEVLRTLADGVALGVDNGVSKLEGVSSKMSNLLVRSLESRDHMKTEIVTLRKVQEFKNSPKQNTY